MFPQIFLILNSQNPGKKFKKTARTSQLFIDLQKYVGQENTLITKTSHCFWFHFIAPFLSSFKSDTLMRNGIIRDTLIWPVFITFLINYQFMTFLINEFAGDYIGNDWPAFGK